MSADSGRITKLVVDKTIVLIFDRKYIIFVSSEYCLGKGQYGKVYEGAEIPSYFLNSSLPVGEEMQSVYNNYKRLENDDLSTDVQDESVQDLNTRIKRRKQYPLACKRVNQSRRSEKERELLRQEAHLQSKYRHSNIIGYYGDYTHNNEIFIIMERCDEDLEQYMRRRHGKKLSENALCLLINQMLDGVHYQHTCTDHIIHRDQKPQNVFIKWVCLCELSGDTGCKQYLCDKNSNRNLNLGEIDRTLCYTDEEIVHTDAIRRNSVCTTAHMFPLVLLGDLGMARITEEASLISTECGTPLYSAPESAHGRYTAKVDIWSLGLVVKYLAGVGQNPIDAKHRADLQVKQKDMNYDVFTGYSAELQQFVRQLLQYNPEDRFDTTTSIAQWTQYNVFLSAFVGDLQTFLRSIKFSVQRVEELTVSAVKNRIHKVQSRDAIDQFYSLEEVKEVLPTLSCAEQVKLLGPRLKNKNFVQEDFYACVVANIVTVDTLYQQYQVEAITMNNILDLVIYEQLPQQYLLLYAMVMVLPEKDNRDSLIEIILARQVNIVPLVCISWNILSISPEDATSLEILRRLDLSCVPMLLQKLAVLEGVALLNKTFPVYVELNELLRQKQRDPSTQVPTAQLEDIQKAEEGCGLDQVVQATQACGTSQNHPKDVLLLLMDIQLVQADPGQWGHCGLNYTLGLLVGTGGVAALLTSQGIGIEVLSMPLPHMPPSLFLYNVYEDTSCIIHPGLLQTLPPVLLLALVDSKLISVDMILLWCQNLSLHRNTLQWFQRYKGVLEYYIQSKTSLQIGDHTNQNNNNNNVTTPTTNTTTTNTNLIQYAIEASKQLHSNSHEGTPHTVSALIYECKQALSLLWCCHEQQDIVFPSFCVCNIQDYLHKSILDATKQGKSTRHIQMKQLSSDNSTNNNDNAKSITKLLFKPKKMNCNMTSLVDYFTASINNAHMICEKMNHVLKNVCSTCSGGSATYHTVGTTVCGQEHACIQPWVNLLMDAKNTLSKHIKMLLPELTSLQAWSYIQLVDAHLYTHQESTFPPALPTIPQEIIKNIAQALITTEKHQTKAIQTFLKQTTNHTVYVSPETNQTQPVAHLTTSCSCGKPMSILALLSQPPKFKSAFVLTQRAAVTDKEIVQMVLDKYEDMQQPIDMSISKKTQLLKTYLKDIQ